MRTILLAVDVAPGLPWKHVDRAIDMAAQHAQGDGDRVVVLHVREFSLARLARNMHDHGRPQCRDAVNQVVARLRDAGVRADGMFREADTGHVAQTILATATEVGAALIVLGTRERTDLPRTPLDMATHLLHLSTLPVLIVPHTHSEPTESVPTVAPAY
jgi:nucleotide-binding universal stress UspA family protein